MGVRRPAADLYFGKPVPGQGVYQAAAVMSPHPFVSQHINARALIKAVSQSGLTLKMTQTVTSHVVDAAQVWLGER